MSETSTETTTDTPAAAGRLAMVTIDCADPRRMAEFWSSLLGWTVAASEDEYAMVTTDAGAALGFGRVEGYEPPPWPDPDGVKQFHLDLDAPDVDAAAARAVELGATLPEHQPGETWRVLLDPAGHPFCFASWGG